MDDARERLQRLTRVGTPDLNNRLLSGPLQDRALDLIA